MKRRTYDKKDKGLVVAMLSLGFLAGCTKPPVEDSVEKVYHTVEFYEDNVGKFYKEVEVEDGTKVEKPADPAARKDYKFAGWWVDEAYSAEFSFDTLIKKIHQSMVNGISVQNTFQMKEHSTLLVIYKIPMSAILTGMPPVLKVLIGIQNHT